MPAPRPLKSAFPLYVLGNTALLSAWIWLYTPVAKWLLGIISREAFQLNGILLLAVLAWVVAETFGRATWPRLSSLPILIWPALALCISSSVLFLLVERFLDVHLLSATLFFMGTYGLLGLYIDPRAWRRS